MTEPQPNAERAAASESSRGDPADPAATSRAEASIQTSVDGSDPHKPTPGAPADSSIPESFGRYKIQKKLGQGAMGVVYLAEDTQLGRKVALKIPKQSALESPEALERFYREAKTTGLIQHPNICPVYDVGAEGGIHYLTMAFIPGQPLGSLLGKKLLPPRQVALLIRKIALALAEAHRQGVIHRDLKPANVMLDDRGEPIVMDFGLARQTNTAEHARLTQTGDILGTPAYMAPEQVRGEVDQIGPRSDIYALGVMLYQFLTGRLPFDGPVLMVLNRVMTESPPRPSELRPDVDPTLEAICLKMMAKAPEDRYPSMAEVAQAVGERLKSPPGSAISADKSDGGPRAVSGDAKRTPQQLQEFAELLEDLLARNDYAETIRLAEEIPDHQRTQKLRELLGEAYELKARVEKLERNLEKFLNQVDVPALKQCLGQLLKIRPAHPRAREIRKVLEKGGRKGIVRFLKPAGHYHGTGLAWEWWQIAAAVGTIGLIFASVSFAVYLYLQNDSPGPMTSSQTPGSKAGNETPAAVSPASAVRPTGEAPSPTKAPFDAEQAKAHQEAWAKHLGVPVETTNSLGMKFRLIPPGTYRRGLSDGELEALLQLDPAIERKSLRIETPRHPVRITQPFWLGTYEVTVGQFRAFAKSSGHVTRGEQDAAANPKQDTWNKVPWPQTDAHPVVNVTWNDAQAFLQWLRRTEQADYRLPAEAEWEYACRAGSEELWWFGNDLDGLVQSANVADAAAKEKISKYFPNLNYIERRDGHVDPAPVGSFRPNPFGLCDTIGNVWEWCSDPFDSYASASPDGEIAVDPRGPAREHNVRVRRGGSWLHGVRHSRPSVRIGDDQETVLGLSYGFRVALSINQPTPANDDLSSTSAPKTDFDRKYPATNLRLVSRRDFNGNRPFQKMNADYEAGGVMGIRSKGGAWGWTVAELDDHQLIRLRLRMKEGKGLVGVGLTQKGDAHGVMVWLGDDRQLELDASMFAKQKGGAPKKVVRLPEWIHPVGDWNELHLVVRPQELEIYVNRQHVTTLDLTAYRITPIFASFAMYAANQDTTVELDELEIFKEKEK